MKIQTFILIGLFSIVFVGCNVKNGDNGGGGAATTTTTSLPEVNLDRGSDGGVGEE